MLVDFGLPLMDAEGQPFNHGSIKNQSTESLVEGGILPDIEGLYEDGKRVCDGIVISHAHLDHFGLMGYVDRSIPVYASAECRRLMDGEPWVL